MAIRLLDITLSVWVWFSQFILPFSQKIYFASPLFPYNHSFKWPTPSQLKRLCLMSLVKQKPSEENCIASSRQLNRHQSSDLLNLWQEQMYFFPLPYFYFLNPHKICEDKIQGYYGSCLVITELYSFYFSGLLFLTNCFYPQVWLMGTKWLQDFQSWLLNSRQRKGRGRQSNP